MKLLRLEFFKCRRRKILLVCAAVLAAELLWLVTTFLRQDAEDLVQGWMLLLYNLAMVDAIIMPISVATIASRNCELEHKGTTLKLLETMAAPGALYPAKLAWGALVLAALLMVRWALFMVTLISWAVSMMVYALQQGLSLRFANQAVALVCGISGSFLGILSLLFPPALTRCVPWGYYGLLSLVGMNWNPDTRFTWFYWEWPAPTDAVLLCLWAALFLVVGRALFVRKEV